MSVLGLEKIKREVWCAMLFVRSNSEIATRVETGVRFHVVQWTERLSPPNVQWLLEGGVRMREAKDQSIPAWRSQAVCLAVIPVMPDGKERLGRWKQRQKCEVQAECNQQTEGYRCLNMKGMHLRRVGVSE